MNGEKKAVDKQPLRNRKNGLSLTSKSVCFANSEVTAGKGVAVAIAVGPYSTAF